MNYYLIGVLGTNELIIIFVLFAVFLVPFILFLLTQQNTLKAISPANRSMQPGEVWLQLIPLFGMVWQFIVVSKIAASLQRELLAGNKFSFEDSRQPAHSELYGEKPTYNIGIAYCILFCCSIIPVLGGLASLGGLVCWIIYWVKVSEYKNRILMAQSARGY
jgi:hypothetical protein